VPDRPPESPQPARKRTILLVGHCFPDAAMLRVALRSAAPDAEFRSINDRAALDAHLRGADLALVNRVLDGDFGVPDGIALIRVLADDARARSPDDVTTRARQQAARIPASRPVLMLVSTYPEAQDQAVSAGALPGFGKSDLYAEETHRRVRDALAGMLMR
jgi:two-component system, chemotaxis family, chemotaxis protein CheY